eukprot:TRINITY_DN4698_c0_g1_i5.p1 TRINITY_DN4698_c0_g1~~TRINITY_DN4698_c0_g1_i5.p1  ORF type:complete len:103 (-),score=21.48 TRINITY_DN4698_c0_g1_i5:67-354(-)
MDSQYTSQGDVSQPNDSTPLTSVGTDAGTGSNLQVDFVFLAKIENAQIVASIINTLFYGKKNEVANVILSPKGIKLTVEQARSFQANTFWALPSE